MHENDLYQLSQQDRDILEHIFRYRITLPEAVQKLFFKDNDNRFVANKLIFLKKRNYIRSYDLYPGKKYWLLGPAALPLFNNSEIITKPLRLEPLTRAFGILAFCCLGEVIRMLMTPQEFKGQFPDYFEPGLPSSSYYIDDDGKKKRLGFIHVDQGADYIRIIRKCRQITHRRAKLEKFNHLLKKDGFLIAIVTAYPDKKRRLEAALRAESKSLSTKYRIEVCPDLVNLI